jgi:hypothetical protein
LVIAEGAEVEEDLFQWERDQVDVKHKVTSGKSVKASLRFFESETVDLHGDTDLEWSLEGVQLACVNRTELMAFIRDEHWKPDIDKLKKHKLADQKDGFWNRIGNKKR